MKKILALVVSVLLVMSALSFATAATITSNTEGHTYKIFQIFTGEVDPDHANGLINLKYGHNTTGAGRVEGQAVTQTDIETLSRIAATAINVTDKEDLAALESFVDISDAKAFETINNGESKTVPVGYYLIKDLDNSQDSQDGSYTLYLMQVVSSTYEITPKADTPEIEKKVKDNNDSSTEEANEAETWQDSADYDIGDAVPFEITATLANNVTAYKTYEIVITDTMGTGLNVPTSTDDIAVTGLPTAADGDTINVVKALTDTGFTVTVTVTTTNDYITSGLNSCVVKVNYSATLNESAKIGSEGNPNTVGMQYTNNPNDKDGGDKGSTPDDTVKVFTYKTVVDKVDPDGRPLTGATFTLYKVPATFTLPATGTNDEKNATIAADSSVITKYTKVVTGAGVNANTFEFKGLDDGTYVLCETVTPTGYNTMAPVLFTISATHSPEAADPQLLTLTATEPFTADNKDAGTVTTPKGNTHERVSGEAYAEIINNSGSTLPSTGGMGTTLLYVGGSILVILAAILLITKRRMSADE